MHAISPALWTILGPSAVALVGVVLTTTFGYLQMRRSHRLQRELEDAKLGHQREQLAWEREKHHLGELLDRKRTDEITRAEAERRRREAATAERERRSAAVRERHSDDDLAQRYRAGLAESLRSLRILDMARPLNLERVYVQVSVVERRIRPPSGEEALQRFKRVAVLGDAGAGKTTMLRYLALRSAQGNLTGFGSFPVYVELRRFVDSGLEDLVSFVVADLDERYGFVDAGPYLEAELDAGGGPWLLDGLDEVLGGSSQEQAAHAYDRVAAEINRFAQRYPNTSIAVTCRRAGWRSTLAAFTSLEVLDFSVEQTDRFIDNWFSDDAELARGLRRALAEPAPLRQSWVREPLRFA